MASDGAYGASPTFVTGFAECHRSFGLSCEFPGEGCTVHEDDLVSDREFRCRRSLFWDFVASCALLLLLLAVYT